MLETAFLQQEHQDVLAKLDVLEKGLTLVEKDQAKARHPLAEATAYLLANLEVHLDREEKGLFPAMEETTGPQGPLHVMLLEHEQLRQALVTIKKESPALATPDPIPARLIPAASDLLTVLRNHIAKEDQILFPMAERTVPHDVLENLERKGSAR